MKRTRLVRRTPLRAVTRITRRTRLRPRSKKASALYVKRRALVEQVLAERPRCEVCGIRPSGTLHERLTRARGGSIVAIENVVAVCVGPGPNCHDRVHANPEWATEQGWLTPSWEA